MNNNRHESRQCGEWTELNLQELDQIFGSDRWMGNGYVFDLLGPKYMYSRVVDRYDPGAEIPVGGEWFQTDSSWGEAGWRKKWINGVHIFRMKIGWKNWRQYVYFRDGDGQDWQRKVNFGLRGNGRGPFEMI